MTKHATIAFAVALLLLSYPVLAAERVRVAVVGDSLCTNSEVPWPARLGKQLGQTHEVRTFAANGLTVTPNVYRSIWSRYEYAHGRDYNPNIAILCFGANAAKEPPGKWRQKGNFIAAYKSR